MVCCVSPTHATVTRCLRFKESSICIRLGRDICCEEEGVLGSWGAMGRGLEITCSKDTGSAFSVFGFV